MCPLTCGKSGRDDWIRTSGLTVPNRARYQTAPRPEAQVHIVAEISALSTNLFVNKYRLIFVRHRIQGDGSLLWQVHATTASVLQVLGPPIYRAP